jgi:hypothetical protein
MNTPTIHNYQDSLKKSTRFINDAIWYKIYSQALPGAIKIVRAPYHHPDGVDRYLCLLDGRTLKVNEIVRQGSWTDILIEEWAGGIGRTSGWIKKPASAYDYIAYVILGTRRCFLIPFPSLQEAWVKNKQEWRELAELKLCGFRSVKAQNRAGYGDYITESIAVPISAIREAVKGVIEVGF